MIEKQKKEYKPVYKLDSGNYRVIEQYIKILESLQFWDHQTADH